jgi:hypothetical protein
VKDGRRRDRAYFDGSGAIAARRLDPGVWAACARPRSGRVRGDFHPAHAEALMDLAETLTLSGDATELGPKALAEGGWQSRPEGAPRYRAVSADVALNIHTTEVTDGRFFPCDTPGSSARRTTPRSALSLPEKP